MKILKEFESFIMRGNVLDLAVAVVVGAAFNKIVSSLVGDLLMPVIGLLLGGVNFASLSWVLKPAEGGSPAVVLGYGAFLQAVVDFLIIAAAVFSAVKVVNRLMRKNGADKAETKPAEPSREEKLLMEIRDILKTKQG